MSKSSRQPIVLMYHGIVSEWTALPGERDVGADLYDVSPINFQQQMQWLIANQYDVDVLQKDSSISNAKQVILTFDDGEMNNYDQVIPILKKCAFPAYFFVIAKHIGQHGYMGWDELKSMHEAGMVIGSHGFSHEILTSLLDTQAQEELRASKRYLQRNLNIEVDALSIPRGFCDDKIIQMAYDAGYKHIFISDRPRALKADCFSRMAVKANWSLKRFEQALDGAVPLNDRVLSKCKSGVKRIFGNGVYDWVRRTVLGVK